MPAPEAENRVCAKLLWRSSRPGTEILHRGMSEMEVQPSAADTAPTAAAAAEFGECHDGKPRLCIQQLVLENFKSYAGVQHIGPFHKSFSSIVGPNGSGKSNVIDALLFVFGKRAKQIRLNKVSELIHNSDEHQNLESARVEVHFVDIVDAEDGAALPVPGSEMIIARAAYRNNSSKYFINGSGATRGDVEELLASKGIDLENNRFLILQGEVEQIAMMKPKGQSEHETGFLEYLEDVIGSNRYVRVKLHALPAVTIAAACACYAPSGCG